MIVGSNLEQVLTSGQFAVTGELGPPKNGDYDIVRKKAQILKGNVDAVNITDCQTAIVRMSSLTAGLIAMSEGVEPVMQMTCRDRNRISIQSDILGASALGIRNLLCLTGDHQKFGNHPQAKGVFDMDSMQLLCMVKAMRDEKKFQCGEEIKGHEPRLFLGAAANPFADPFEYRPVRLGKKVDAGASFIQTQIVYNVKKFARFMEMVRDLGLHERVYILAGVTPPKSLGMARYMKNFVPGLDVTDEVIERLKGAKDPREEGINICVDIINQVRDIPGVAGVHVMAIGWEKAVPEIVSRVGLLPRPEAKIEPVLMGRESIDLMLSSAREEVKAGAEKDIEQAKVEAQASRELLMKEKGKVASEISELKKQARQAEDAVGQRDAQIESLTRELAETKTKLEHAKETEAVGVPVEEIEVSALSLREQKVLDSLRMGLDALCKGLGLNENQLEAFRRLFEAESLLCMGTTTRQAFTVPTERHPKKIAAPKKEITEEVEKKIEKEDAEARARHKKVVNLVAQGNVFLHKDDASGAVKAFEQALAIEPENLKAQEGLGKAKKASESAAPPKEAAVPPMPEGIPPCPEGLSPEEWLKKWIIRLVAKGNLSLHKGNIEGASRLFRDALRLDPANEKAEAGLARAKAGVVPGPETGQKAEEIVPPGPVEPMPKAKAEAPPRPEPVPKPKPGPAPKPEAKAAAPHAPEEKLLVLELAKETRSLTERAGSVPEDQFIEPCTGAIREVKFGKGEKSLTVGGEATLPFHIFEGDMVHAPQVAFEVLDSAPDEWPDVLSNYYSDVFSDPLVWAKKCIKEYGAKAICLSLISSDPNGMNRPSNEVAKAAQSVIEGIDVPVILWGCGNAEKDTETLREVTNLVGDIGDRKVCLGPLSDANYRALGATAMAFQLPVVASTPIDVNLAKQLNILLENLGVSLNQVVMDPSIGAVGYGIEYAYSVIERVRLAALTQQDEKLQVPFICNLGREVWKAKECRLPSDALMGDQERRAILMEAITASILLLAGGELMVMRHPKAVALTEALIKAMME